MTHHTLKTDREPFDATWRGTKNFEVRGEDTSRVFQAGDTVTLVEQRHRGEHDATIRRYTGRAITARVTHVQRGYGLPAGLAVLGLELGSTLTGHDGPVI